MSTLGSASTLAQVQAAYDDNASYAEDNSVPKARAFATACRILLRRLPAETGSREAHVRLDLGQIQAELTSARAWLQSRDTGPASGNPSVTRVSFENFR